MNLLQEIYRNENYQAAAHGDYEQAIEKTKTLIGLELADFAPDNETLGILFSDLYYFFTQNNQYPEAYLNQQYALGYHKKALGPNPDLQNPILVKLVYDGARIAEGLGEYDEAIADYQSLLATDRATDAKFRIALCLEGKGDYQWANEFYNTAAMETAMKEGQLSMKLAGIYFNYGNFLAKQLNFEMALLQYKLAKNIVALLDPDEGRSLSELDDAMRRISTTAAPQISASSTSNLFLVAYQQDPIPEIYDPDMHLDLRCAPVEEEKESYNFLPTEEYVKSNDSVATALTTTVRSAGTPPDDQSNLRLDKRLDTKTKYI